MVVFTRIVNRIIQGHDLGRVLEADQVVNSHLHGPDQDPGLVLVVLTNLDPGQDHSLEALATLAAVQLLAWRLLKKQRVIDIA